LACRWLGRRQHADAPPTWTLAPATSVAVTSSATNGSAIRAKAMFLAKLKATIATLMVVAVLGGGLAYSGSGGSQAKPQNELEALRRENELLKVNLRVTLEKIEAMEKQVNDLKGQVSQKETATDARRLAEMENARRLEEKLYADRVTVAQQRRAEDAAKKARAAAEADRDRKLADIATLLRGRTEQLESAMDALRKAQASQDNKDARRQALDALEKALKSLREAETKKK